MTSAPPSLEQSASLTRTVSLLSIVTALTLVILKLAIWRVSGSVALMASMADSGLDLIASCATFFAIRYAAAPPDKEHRFGHGKAEAFASLVQAGLVFASAALVGQEALHHLVHPTAVSHETWALLVMGLSILLTGGLIVAQTWLLRRARSVAVSADRTHYAADLASNIIALAGVAAATALGIPALDALAALLVTALLLWGAISVFRGASGELLDHELPDAERAKIIELALQDPAVRDIHQLRTRASGPVTHMQMHAGLDPEVSLVAAHRIVVAAEKRILSAFPTADIIIHPDPRGRAEPHGGAFAEVHEE